MNGGTGQNAGFGSGSTGGTGSTGGASQGGTGSPGGGAGYGGGGGGAWVGGINSGAGAGGSYSLGTASFAPGSNGGLSHAAGGNGSVTIDTCDGSGGGSSSPEMTPVVETLSLATTAAGATCTGGNPSGNSGSWLTLPSADQCTPSGTSVKAGAKLLGWSTSESFPIARAQAQVDKHWGVIDETIDSMRMIFIPAGMATFISGSNNLYPIWSE